MKLEHIGIVLVICITVKQTVRGMEETNFYPTNQTNAPDAQVSYLYKEQTNESEKKRAWKKTYPLQLVLSQGGRYKIFVDARCLEAKARIMLLRSPIDYAQIDIKLKETNAQKNHNCVKPWNDNVTTKVVDNHSLIIDLRYFWSNLKLLSLENASLKIYLHLPISVDLKVLMGKGIIKFPIGHNDNTSDTKLKLNRSNIRDINGEYTKILRATELIVSNGAVSLARKNDIDYPVTELKIISDSHGLLDFTPRTLTTLHE